MTTPKEKTVEELSTTEAMQDLGVKKSAFFKYRKMAGVKPRVRPGRKNVYTRDQVETIRQTIKSKEEGSSEHVSVPSPTGQPPTNPTMKDSVAQELLSEPKTNIAQPESKSLDNRGEGESELVKELREQISFWKKETVTKNKKIEEQNEDLQQKSEELGRWKGQAEVFQKRVLLLESQVQMPDSQEDIIYAGSPSTEPLKEKKKLHDNVYELTPEPINDTDVKEAEFTEVGERESEPLSDSDTGQKKSKKTKEKPKKTEKKKERRKKSKKNKVNSIHTSANQETTAKATKKKVGFWQRIFGGKRAA